LWFGGRGRSIWWHQLKKVIKGVGMVDGSWLVNNVARVVGDESSTFFLEGSLSEDVHFIAMFNRLYELAYNKLVCVADMCNLGWRVNGEAWKWRRKLFVWGKI